MATKLAMPSLSSAKDPACSPLLRGDLSRWIWRLLTQRLTPAGRWFALISLIFIVYGGLSLRIQGYVLASYAVGLWVIAIGALRLFRPRVSLDVRMSPRVSVGQTLPVDVEIEQHSRARGADLVVVPHQLPLEIDSIPENGTLLPDLPPGTRARAQLGLRCHRRGKYLIRGFRVETTFPFGVLRSRRVFEQPRSLLVYPTFTALSHLRLPTGRRYQPGGVALTSELGESFEYLGNREYREGDNVRDIDWRATARAQRPIVREWVEEYMLRVAVILDTHVPARANQKQLDAFERAVSISAAVSDYMARQDYLVDLFAAGPNLYHLTAGRSLAYLDQILDILACVEANPDEPFDVIEPQIAELLSRISTVICVFLDWNEARREFVQRIQMQGTAVKVILVRDGRPSIAPLIDGESDSFTTIDSDQFRKGVDEL